MGVCQSKRETIWDTVDLEVKSKSIAEPSEQDNDKIVKKDIERT